MRLVTHVVFGLGVASVAGRLVGCTGLCLLPALALTPLLHAAIDWFGHETGLLRGGARRLALTHSVPGALLASALVYSPVAALLRSLGLRGYLVPWIPLAASGLSHLLLDLVTPQGVYLCGRRRRIRLARSGSPVANLAFQAVGAGLLVLGLSGHW